MKREGEERLDGNEGEERLGGSEKERRGSAVVKK